MISTIVFYSSFPKKGGLEMDLVLCVVLGIGILCVPPYFVAKGEYDYLTLEDKKAKGRKVFWKTFLIALIIWIIISIFVLSYCRLRI